MSTTAARVDPNGARRRRTSGLAVDLAERILVLNFGELIADGDPHDVMRLPEVVTAYLGDQAAAQ